MLGLDDVAVARDDISARFVGDDQQRLQAPQAAVAAPILGELDRRTGEIAELLELALEALEQREGIGGAARESREDLAVVEAPHFAGVALHDALPERDLTVSPDGDTAVAPYREDRGAMDARRIMIHNRQRVGARAAVSSGARTQRGRRRRARGCEAS
jgi:hypothetical protein